MYLGSVRPLPLIREKHHSNLIGRRLIPHDSLASFEFTHFFNPRVLQVRPAMVSGAATQTDEPRKRLVGAVVQTDDVKSATHHTQTDVVKS